MPELTPQQVAVLERLLAHGFRSITLPLFTQAIGVRRGECAALLQTSPDGSLQIFGAPSWLVENNLSVRLRREGREWFVWKKTQVAATPARLKKLEQFREELQSLLVEAV